MRNKGASGRGGARATAAAERRGARAALSLSRGEAGAERATAAAAAARRGRGDLSLSLARARERRAALATQAKREARKVATRQAVRARGAEARRGDRGGRACACRLCVSEERKRTDASLPRGAAVSLPKSFRARAPPQEAISGLLAHQQSHTASPSARPAEAATHATSSAKRSFILKRGGVREMPRVRVFCCRNGRGAWLGGCLIRRGGVC